MDNANEKDANEIYINFNNENYEFEHDYTKPFSRSKSIVERSSYSINDSIQTETYKSKKTNKTDENNQLTEIKKEFYTLSEDFNFHKNHFNKNILSKDLIQQKEFINLFSLMEKQNILLNVSLMKINLFYCC